MVSSEILVDYIGTYDMAGQDLVVTLEDNQLMAERVGANKLQFFAESESNFFSNENVQLEFVRGDDGIVTHAIVRFGSSEVTAQRKPNDG